MSEFIHIGIYMQEREKVKDIKALICAYMKKEKIEYSLHSFGDKEKVLRNQKVYDLFFLSTKQNETGIQIGTEIRSRNPEVKLIYFSDNNNDMQDAINKIDVFSYLGSNITQELFETQLEEALFLLEKERQKPEVVYFDILEITQENQIHNVQKEFETKEIYYFEYIDRKVKIQLAEKEYFIIATMKSVVEKMKIYDFVQCHQNYLVNLKHIKRIKFYNVFLDNNQNIPVAQKRSVILRKNLNHLYHEI